MIKKENIRIGKNPIKEYDSNWSDEYDYYDFCYCLGLQLPIQIETGICKVVSYSTNAFTGEEKVSLPKFIKLELARDAKEYGENLLNSIFSSFDGNFKIYKLSNRKGLCIVHTHHDNPVNGDYIIITPSKKYKEID